jgi:2-oxoglutarate ferredoxin oxidoreductase subunit delta
MNEKAFPKTEQHQEGSIASVVGQKRTEDVKKPGQKKKKSFQVEILKTLCKSCGICVAFCPLHCFELDDTGCPLLAKDTCSGCGWCELYCPDFAISVVSKN